MSVFDEQTKLIQEHKEQKHHPMKRSKSKEDLLAIEPLLSDSSESEEPPE